MAKTCRAAVYRDTDKPISVENVTIASPRKNEVMVKIAACGVCHTDLSVINGSFAPLLTPPIILGHEASGTVIEIGEDVTDLSLGDHVVVSWTANCGKCTYCRIGKPELCDESDKSRVTLRDGSTPIKDASGNPIGPFLGVGVMAEYATMSRDNVVKISSTIPFASSSLLGCAVTTGVGAVVNTAKVRPGSTVVVFGIGGVGISVIQGAALSGATKIIAVSGSEHHLELARQFGATHFINSKKDENPSATIQTLTQGGADYAFECAGIPSIIALAYDCIRKGGTAIVVGLTKLTDTVTLPAATIMLAEKTLTGSNYGSARPNIDFPKFLALYEMGLLKLDEMVTRHYKIDDVNQAFTDLSHGKNIRGLIVF